MAGVVHPLPPSQKGTHMPRACLRWHRQGPSIHCLVSGYRTACPEATRAYSAVMAGYARTLHYIVCIVLFLDVTRKYLTINV